MNKKRGINNCTCGHRSKGYSEKNFLKAEIDRGMKVEFEHSCDPKFARRIAMDHIAELGPQYYPELEKLEAKLSKLKQGVPDKRVEQCPVYDPTVTAKNPKEHVGLVPRQILKPGTRFDTMWGD